MHGPGQATAKRGCRERDLAGHEGWTCGSPRDPTALSERRPHPDSPCPDRWQPSVAGRCPLAAGCFNRFATSTGWQSPYEVFYSRLPDLQVVPFFQEGMMRVDRRSSSDVQSVPCYFLNNRYNHPSSAVKVIKASTGGICSPSTWCGRFRVRPPCPYRRRRTRGVQDTPPRWKYRFVASRMSRRHRRFSRRHRAVTAASVAAIIAPAAVTAASAAATAAPVAAGAATDITPYPFEDGSVLAHTGQSAPSNSRGAAPAVASEP